MPAPLSTWIGFNLLVLAVLAIDLLLFGRTKTPPVGRLVAALLAYLAVAAGVGFWVGARGGTQVSLDFFTGYLIEYALSLDNVLLFVLIFSSFGLTTVQQRRVLYWGVIGALLMRGIMIGAGVALLSRFVWIFYVFGAYLVYVGAGFFRKHAETPVHERKSVRFARRWLPMTRHDAADHFVIREEGRLRFTLLFLTLIVVEATDLVFACDSIPAVFGVTTDPFIVYSSNACAVLGLRSLYFLVAHAVKNLVYLQPGLGVVLVFIGAKMLLRDWLPITTVESLAVIGAVFAVTLVASLRHGPGRKGAHAHSG